MAMLEQWFSRENGGSGVLRASRNELGLHALLGLEDPTPSARNPIHKSETQNHGQGSTQMGEADRVPGVDPKPNPKTRNPKRYKWTDSSEV